MSDMRHALTVLTGADKIAAMDWWQDMGGSTPLSQYEFAKSGSFPDETIPHQAVLLSYPKGTLC